VCNAAVCAAVEPAKHTQSGGGGGGSGGGGGILPRLLGGESTHDGRKVLDSWEELLANDGGGGGGDGDGGGVTQQTPTSRHGIATDDGIEAAVGGGLISLRWLVWPDADGRRCALIPKFVTLNLEP
jgi:hypothetical protein